MAELALSVWPVAQKPARVQRRTGYLPESNAHPGKMLPELARAIIASYSEPGQLALDPMCGIGTTLVEAIHLNREAIGVELEPRWAALTASNVRLAREQGATANALALRGDARQLGNGLLDDLAGSVALIVSSPTYGPSTHGHVRKHLDRVEKLNTSYSHNPDAPVAEIGNELEIEATTTVDHRLLDMTWSPLGTLRAPATLHVKARLT